VYQYSLSMIAAAEQVSQHEFSLLVDDPEDPRVAPFAAKGWRILPAFQPSPPGRARSLARRALGNGVAAKAVRQLRSSARPPSAPEALPDIRTIQRRDDQARWWRDHAIDLVVYAAPSPLSFEVGIPYITAIHDVQHRLQPELLEVSDHGEWQSREYVYRNSAVHATAVLVDSEVGRDQFLSFYGAYGVEPARVKVLPFLPASYVTQPSLEERRRVRAAYGVPDRYLIYPGQFWPHKNHARIIQALEQLKLSRKQEIAIVFCGSHSGELRERQFRLINDMAEYCGVAAQVSYLGYVPDPDVAALYADAVALVMPTLFGPTNIPPLEAWACGCPVLSSDIEGIREQLGDAALLVDPRSVAALANGISEIWTNDALRERLMQAGRERIGSFTAADFRRRLSDILDEAAQWAAPLSTK
jgi:glycosyltransferase involved in cell wall biosynthesis